MNEVSRRVRAAEAAFAPVADFYFRSRYADRRFQKGVADFTFGNPQEMPIDGLVSALRDSAIPQNRNWFAYKTSEDEPRAFLAEHREATFSAQMALGWTFPSADAVFRPRPGVAVHRPGSARPPARPAHRRAHRCGLPTVGSGGDFLPVRPLAGW